MTGRMVTIELIEDDARDWIGHGNQMSLGGLVRIAAACRAALDRLDAPAEPPAPQVRHLINTPCLLCGAPHDGPGSKMDDGRLCTSPHAWMATDPVPPVDAPEHAYDIRPGATVDTIPPVQYWNARCMCGWVMTMTDRGDARRAFDAHLPIRNADVAWTEQAADQLGDMATAAGVNPNDVPPVDAPEPCRHEDSLYGRCTRCGMTWGEQAAKEAAPVDAPEPGTRWQDAQGEKVTATEPWLEDGRWYTGPKTDGNGIWLDPTWRERWEPVPEPAVPEPPARVNETPLTDDEIRLVRALLEAQADES